MSDAWSQKIVSGGRFCEMLHLTPNFETLRLTRDFETLRLAPARCQPDATF